MYLDGIGVRHRNDLALSVGLESQAELLDRITKALREVSRYEDAPSASAQLSAVLLQNYELLRGPIKV